MRLQRIYSSKFYATSSRRDRIHAAITNPINAELVQQLSDYLDNDAKEILHESIKEESTKREEAQEASKTAKSEEENDKKFPNEENNVFSPSYHGGSTSANNDTFDDLGDEGEGPDIFAEPENEAPVESAPVEESSEISGMSITADSDIDDALFDITNQIEIIKGTLNGIANTAGVQRINIDDKELWIYYKDEVNSGDIMVDVIETLNGANYNYLTFSRLARSNNAIVFDITANMQEPMKTIDEIKEEA